jgi:hypothetical protein
MCVDCGEPAQKIIAGHSPWKPGVAWKPVCVACYDAYVAEQSELATAYLEEIGAPPILKMSAKVAELLVHASKASTFDAALFTTILAYAHAWHSSVEYTMFVLSTMHEEDECCVRAALHYEDLITQLM